MRIKGEAALAPFQSRRPLRTALPLLLLFICLPASLLAQDPEPAKAALKLLMVGNSFSRNSAVYLPGLAKAGGKTLVLLNCVKSGCTLEEHAQGIQAAGTDPESPAARIYVGDGSYGIDPSFPTHFNLQEALQYAKWDDATIQQASILSYKAETYEPFAHAVVDAIHQYAPQAEILVHETWAYREDDPLFAKDGFTQEKMYAGLSAAYAKLASDYQLRVLPVGDAFQAARATERWHYLPDPAFDFTHSPATGLPNQQGSLNRGWYQSANGLQLDARHANPAGEYLGAAVLYEVLFGENVENVSFCPRELKPEEAADLRKIAHETVQARKNGAFPPANS